MNYDDINNYNYHYNIILINNNDDYGDYCDAVDSDVDGDIYGDSDEDDDDDYDDDYDDDLLSYMLC